MRSGASAASDVVVFVLVIAVRVARVSVTDARAASIVVPVELATVWLAPLAPSPVPGDVVMPEIQDDLGHEACPAGAGDSGATARSVRAEAIRAESRSTTRRGHLRDNRDGRGDSDRGRAAACYLVVDRGCRHAAGLLARRAVCRASGGAHARRKAADRRTGSLLASGYLADGQRLLFAGGITAPSPAAGCARGGRPLCRFRHRHHPLPPLF